MVQEQVEKEAVLKAMSDDYTRRIIVSTIAFEKSIEELSEDNKIPISTCYRRVHELLAEGLLRVEHTILTAQGKKYETFKSEVRGVDINLRSGEVVVDVKPNPRTLEEKLQDQSLAKSHFGEDFGNLSGQPTSVLLLQAPNVS